jgi:hypothetical protein
MKNKILLLAVAMMLSFASFAQFTFSVSPGQSLNGASFGFKVMDNIVPYVGFQHIAAKGFYNETSWEYMYTGGLQKVEYETTASVSILIPHIGVKFFFIEKDDLKAYANLSLAKPMLSAKAEQDGEDIDEIEDQINDLKIFGAELGFGVEYYLAEQFSIGGEFGFRYLRVRHNMEYDTEIYNPNTGYYDNSQVEAEFGLSIRPTYNKISLNYYF